MRWENLTMPDFARAVTDCDGVGIVPIGVLEPHSTHMPLGTDMFESHWVACKAAEREPALVFPQYCWGINHEAMHQPGSLVIKRELVFALLANVCEELGRHGFKKILLLSGHGGNRNFLPLFVQTQLETPKDYCVYFGNIPHWRDSEALMETPNLGHACEAETSTALYLHPELVKMEVLPDEPAPPDTHGNAVRDAYGYSPADWYSQYPRMYVGDGHPGTAEKGKILIERRVDDLVELIRVIKADEATGAMMREFQGAALRPVNPWEQD